MSEDQYYEFRAVDRSLTDRQMQKLRAISTRAAISRTSFSNYYTFGVLKSSNPSSWSAIQPAQPSADCPRRPSTM